MSILFGHTETVKPIEIKNIEIHKAFKERPLPVVEIFGNTIQGEGPRLRPAIFIRLGMCNLKCPGFGCTRIAPNGESIVGCDTIHAVSPKFKDTWMEYNSFTDMLPRIEPLLYTENGTKVDVIITGGEPTMHWDNATFQEMLKWFAQNDFHVTVESNGSKKIEFSESYQAKVQFSLSVKLSNSGEPERKRWDFDALKNIIANSNESYLKFVVNPEIWNTLSAEIATVIKEAKEANPDIRVYLMPLGETIDKQLKNIRFTFDVCAENGFWFSPRAHILAYDDKDGV